MTTSPLLPDPTDSAPPAPSPQPSATARLASILRARRADEDRRWGRRIAVFAATLLTLTGGAWATIHYWPRRIPAPLFDDLDNTLDYMLLTEDFNRLPIDKRLGLIKDMISRLKTMSGEDSAMLAAFAARLQSAARDQLEKNAKRLAIDMADNYANQYATIPPGEQGDFLDRTVLEFTKTLEDIGGERSGLPADDGERLARLKEQAKKDEKSMQENRTRMNAGNVAGFLRMANKDADKVASPVQQARLARFARDMTRHLRGQDPQTGIPLPGGG